ncbi:fas-activated serine/threonine kinase isoform X5 [Odocoileus virginianus]|uniref:Fas-activated serine/threonine kinase isoform X5 n=1 Tax=Odocoileus virginianus TaxID=9874 RepID=A0ABM4H5Q5_ODOVR
MRRPRGEPGSRAPRPTEGATCAGPGESCEKVWAGRPKPLVQGHAAGKWERPAWNPGPRSPRSTLRTSPCLPPHWRVRGGSEEMMHVELLCKNPSVRTLKDSDCSRKGSPAPNSMLRVLLSAQASSARLSGLLLLPPVQPCCLGPNKWGDHRPPGGGPRAGPVQGLQRLLEQARSPGELLRWLGQNPTKVRAHHYPVALRRLSQLLGSLPRPPPVEQATLQDLSQLIIRNCPSFDIHTIHVCLHLAALLGFPSDGPLICTLEQERRFRLPPKPPPPLPPILRGGQRLEAALSCPRFQRRPQQHLIRSLAEARPEELTPHVMVLLAQHLARHRLREPQLLEAIAHFLVVQEAQLNSKVVQKLVLPFGRLNYVPLEQQFMPCLERILAREAGVAPLATVNILMSLCQLRCLPFRALHFVFSPGFINHVSGTPHALIVRRYLSLLDTAVELELPGYQGARLPRRQQVPIFPQPLITDRARCKYSHKDIVAEGLRQLLGEEKYRQDLTVPPGYSTGPVPAPPGTLPKGWC